MPGARQRPCGQKPPRAVGHVHSGRDHAGRAPTAPGRCTAHDGRGGWGRQPHTIRPVTASSESALALFAAGSRVLGLIVVGLLGAATLGLALAEHVDAWYAFRWSLDTAATVGGFPQPRTTAGQVIHVALIVVGVGTLFYALAIVAEFFAAGHLGEVLAGRRSQRMIDSLENHHIVCAYGRVGRSGRARPARRPLQLRGDRSPAAESPAGGEGGAAVHRGRRQRGRRPAALPGSGGPARSSCVPTPTRTTCSSPSPPASCARTSRSWPGPPPRTPRRSSPARAPIA